MYHSSDLRLRSRNTSRFASPATLQRLDPRVLLSAWFDYDVVVRTGDAVAQGGSITDIFDASINARGRVGFTGTTASGQGLFADNGSAATTQLVGFNPSSSRTFNFPHLNDSGSVAAADRVSGAPTSFLVRTWDSSTTGVFNLVASNLSNEPAPGFDSVTLPTVANDGQFAFIGIRSGGTGLYRNATQVRGANTLVTNLSGGGFRPMIADGGVTVIRDGTGTTGSLRINATAMVTTGAGGWTALGAAPGISDDASAVVFSGDRGNGPGIFAFIKNGASYDGPFKIAGENSPAINTAELGFDAAGSKLGINSIDYAQRVGVAYYSGGAAGPIGDSFVVSFIGTPNSASINNSATGSPFFFNANKGVWSERVDIKPISGAAGYDVLATSPLPVAQVGQTIGGVAITDVSLWDPVTRADFDLTTGAARVASPGDHHVVLRAAMAGGSAIIRASKLDLDADGLMDHWERAGGGIDADADGAVDLSLAAWGAAVDHKDIFLEMDWQRNVPGKNFVPPKAAIDFFEQQFNNAPVTNPDGTTGINVHIDAGNNPSLTRNTGTGSLQGGDNVTQGGSFIDVVFFGTPGTAIPGAANARSLSNIKDSVFGTAEKRAREWAFRYVFTGDTHSSVGNGSGGVAEIKFYGTDNDADGFGDQTIPGNDMIVSLQGGRGNPATLSSPPAAPGGAAGPTINPAPANFVWGNDLIHEFGHTIGLQHGGVNSTTSVPPFASFVASGDYSAASFSTNYQSVMNYAYTFWPDNAGTVVRGFSGAADPVFNDWGNLKLNFSDYLAAMGNSFGFGLAPGTPAGDDEHVELEEIAEVHGPLDPATPLVESGGFEFETDFAVAVDFNKDVSDSLSGTDMTVRRIGGGGTVAVASVEIDFATDTGRFVLPSSMPDGNYSATLPRATVTDSSGNPLPADFTLDFFVLAGDTNRDRTVDITDLGTLATNWQQSPRTFSQGDFNHDDVVDITDLGILATNWQKSLSASRAARRSPPVFADAPVTSFARQQKPPAARVIEQIEQVDAEGAFAAAG
jgi:hypothetical protein